MKRLAILLIIGLTSSIVAFDWNSLNPFSSLSAGQNTMAIQDKDIIVISNSDEDNPYHLSSYGQPDGVLGVWNFGSEHGWEGTVIKSKTLSVKDNTLILTTMHNDGEKDTTVFTKSNSSNEWIWEDRGITVRLKVYREVQ
jgi:hypothetical protein